MSLTPPSISQVDLSAFATDQQTPKYSKLVYRKPRLLKWFLVALLSLGLMAILGIAMEPLLFPPHSVTVVPVIATRSEVHTVGTVVFQAAGWIEPRPSLVNVAAMVEGVVEEVLVVEGQSVQANDTIAKLVDTDAKLAVRQANATLRLRKSELGSREAECKAAKLRFENPVHLQAPLAEALSLLAKSETELAKLPFQLQIAEAQLKFADEGLKEKEGSEGAISSRVLSQARNDRLSAFATVEELKQRTPRLKSEINAVRNRVDALSSQLSLLIDETLQVEDSAARLNAAAASLDEAELAVEISELRVQRTKVLAPIPGRILRILVQPGSRVMGLEVTSAQSSSTVASMYDPNRLQVRVDVRLEDFTRVVPGQSVRIETASIREPILGTVLLPTSSANIQKNTIDVKVAIDEPPAGIRPEMLASASFIAMASDSKDVSPSEKLSLYVPRELIQSNDEGRFVWIVDANSRAIRRSVVVGSIGPNNSVEVNDGLFPTDRLIASGYDSLRQNSKVVVRGEHETLGVNQSKPFK
jgi:HlyD family secretion protein